MGVAITKRVWPVNSPMESRRRKAPGVRISIAVFMKLSYRVTKHASEYLALCSQNRREQKVFAAQLTPPTRPQSPALNRMTLGHPVHSASALSRSRQLLLSRAQGVGESALSFCAPAFGVKESADLNVSTGRRKRVSSSPTSRRRMRERRTPVLSWFPHWFQNALNTCQPATGANGVGAPHRSR